MRRARIKALAAVPVRKKTVQDTVVSSDGNNVPDEEQKKKDVSNIDKQEQDAIRDVAEIKKEEDKSSNKLDRESVKNVENVKEKIIEEKEDEADSVKQEAVMTEQINSQKFGSPVKATFQEPCIQLSDKPEKVTNQLAQKIVPPPDVPTIDIASPTKLTQSRSCFTRPTPRLDSSGRIRKNSIQGSGASASESEDEHGKRAVSVVSNRVRNDSICSVQSNKESTINDSQNNSPKIKSTQKRRMLISESARKLAEARREFLLKHENKAPDRTKMKMYDLIYYNPVTNPMKKSTVQRQEIESIEVVEEEDEDDPSAIPAPRVKVGPDGQLIIDEQSLVIEQTGVKKGRQILASEAIIEDDNNRSGGFYKKHKRSKDWPNWETFKFYRVLNVVGPDFLLMQTVFPNRTRQEIKQKYKKEERVNRHLIEKALKYHQEFDTKLLEQQLEMLKGLENFENHKLPTKKALEKTKGGQPMTKKAKRLKRRLVAGSIGECESSSLNDPELEDAMVAMMGDEIDVVSTEEANVDETSVQRQQARKESSKARKMKRRADDRYDKSDDDSSYASSNADSESDPEVYQVRPTRSGRQPKVKKLRAPDINMLDRSVEGMVSLNSEATTSLEVTEEASTPAEDGGNAETPDSMALPNINQMEPGSLVIVSKESEEDPEDTILQVYMVGPNVDGCAAKPNLTPVDLPPKLLTTVTNESLSKDAESIGMDNCEH